MAVQGAEVTEEGLARDTARAYYEFTFFFFFFFTSHLHMMEPDNATP